MILQAGAPCKNGKDSYGNKCSNMTVVDDAPVANKYDITAFMVYINFAYIGAKISSINQSLFKPFIAGSGEHFENNTVDLSEELDTYNETSERLLLLKKAITEFEYLNLRYRSVDE